MNYLNYECFKITIADYIARVTIDYPPLNIMDSKLLLELDDITKKIEKDDAVKVIIFDSANSDFFMAHADLEYLLKLSPSEPVTKSLGLFHTIGERIRTMPKVSIAKITGRARGGGSELVLAMDMRFAVKDKTYLAQPEIAIGIIPTGGGTQRLPRLIGRARALEVILTGADFSSDIAERYGYINRAIPESDIDSFVNSLAERICKYTSESIRAVKLTVNSSENGYVDGLMNEYFEFLKIINNKNSRELINLALEKGAQTYEVELELDSFLKKMHEGINK